MRRITLRGLASKSTQSLLYRDQELDETLLNWLRSRDITIASSCSGKGICKKCVIQNGWQSCQLTLRNFLKAQPDGKIFVSYL